MPLVGPVRFTYIEERLDMLGLDMRDPDQSVVSRAKQLFGSIKDIPIQVLALCIVVHANRPGATIAGYRYSRAIGEIVKLQSVAKVGTFLPDHPRSKARKTTREKLCSFLIEKAAPKALLEERMFNLLAEDLEEVLEFWRKQR